MMAHFLNALNLVVKKIALLLLNYMNIVSTSFGSSSISTKFWLKHYINVSNIPHYHKLKKTIRAHESQK